MGEYIGKSYKSYSGDTRSLDYRICKGDVDAGTMENQVGKDNEQ